MEKAIRILVIEDDLSLCDALSEIFKSQHYLFQILNSASNILNVVASFKPNVILLDYVLPCTNGGEICCLLRHDKNAQQIPIIIYSALSLQMLSISECLYDSFIEKPFDLKDLIDGIERHSKGLRAIF